MQHLLQSQAIAAETAFQIVDQQVFEHTNKRLNDLERQVFIGSWQDKTYSEIYPANPPYVEKSVGYKLWRKLSEVLGERVRKKQLKSAVMRSLSDSLTPQRVLICYHTQLHQHPLPRQLSQALMQQGHEVTLADESNEADIQSLRQRLERTLTATEGSAAWDYLVFIVLVESAATQ